jgi:putative transposase
MRTELVANALHAAVATRGGRVDAGVVFHSDRESGRYISAEFGELCERYGVVQSMGATGMCWDNAAAESFSGSLKCEHANRRRWATRADARRDLMRWIEGRYDQRRLHSSIDCNSPVDHEAEFTATVSLYRPTVRRTGAWSGQRMMMLSQCQVYPTGMPSLSGV